MICVHVALRRSLKPGVIFGGRLASYKYYDMHQLVGQALSRARAVLAP
jgi:UDP-galactopyranose mutase